MRREDGAIQARAMVTFLVRQAELHMLLVQARDEDHLREILYETGEIDDTLSWSRCDEPLVVHLKMPMELIYGPNGKLRDVDVEAALPNLVEHVPLTGYIRANDPIQIRSANAMLNALCPNAGSVLTAAYRHADDASNYVDVSIDPKQLRTALREDLHVDGQLPAARRKVPPGTERLHLYWVQTDDHDEDWFIVAASPVEACQFHEAQEGYAPGDAWAEFVATVPATAPNRTDGWPSDELLIACGAKIDRSTTPRVVRFGRRTYAEGMLEGELRKVTDDVSERVGQGRPNGTPPQSTN